MSSTNAHSIDMLSGPVFPKILLFSLPLAATDKAALLLASTLGVAVLVGIVESVMARMRFLKTPQVLSGALMVAILATLLFVLF